MKKSLLALAAMGAFVGAAQAQSSVTVYGVIDKAVSSTTTKTTAAGVTTKVQTDTTGGSGNGGVSNQNYTTERIGFRGTEDLGGGLRATFNLEMRIGVLNSADSGTEADGLPIRQSNVGLAGSFGSVTIGRQTSLMEGSWGAGNASELNNFLGTLYFSGQKFNNSRSDRLVTYASPNFNGFVLAAQYGSNETKTTTTSASTTGQDEMAIQLSYAQGPLTVSVTHLKEEAKTANAVSAKPEGTVAGANYNFGPATAFVTYAQGKNSVPNATANDRSAYEAGVRVPVTKAITLQASTYKGSDKVTAAATKSDVSGFQLSAKYNFSPRTNLYAVVGSDETKNTAAGTKTERDAFGVGIKHTF